MPLSLKSQLKKLAHKGHITAEEYDALVDKLAGHDRELRASVIDEFAERILDYWDKRGTAQTILFLKDVAEQLKGE